MDLASTTRSFTNAQKAQTPKTHARTHAPMLVVYGQETNGIVGFVLGAWHGKGIVGSLGWRLRPRVGPVPKAVHAWKLSLGQLFESGENNPPGPQDPSPRRIVFEEAVDLSLGVFGPRPDDLMRRPAAQPARRRCRRAKYP